MSIELPFAQHAERYKQDRDEERQRRAEAEEAGGAARRELEAARAGRGAMEREAAEMRNRDPIQLNEMMLKCRLLYFTISLLIRRLTLCVHAGFLRGGHSPCWTDGRFCH